MRHALNQVLGRVAALALSFVLLAPPAVALLRQASQMIA
jgi:hypothetical protein